MGTGRSRGALRLALALTLLTLSAAMTAPSGAQEAALELNPAGTRIDFTLRGFPHTVHGTFKLKRGTIRIDSATGRADGLVIVDAASGDSGNRTRDSDMNESVLETQRYPEIRFTPQQVEAQGVPQGEFRVKIRGVFWLHGTEHEVTLDALVRLAGEEWTATTHFVVPYVAWGLRDPSILILRVADKVEVDVNATGHVTWTPVVQTKSGGTSKEPGR
ncbi:MAG: YceI family protein [Candidatus Methylomirabilales bacterium]